MNAEIVKAEHASPAALLSQAIEKGLDVSALEKLMDLQDRHNAAEARKAFFDAFTRFQAQCPDLRKTKSVSFNQTNYNYAPLSDIARQIGKALKDNDLSYRWEITDTATEIKVTCLVSHIAGHTEKTTMQADPDKSGAKNSIQSRGSTITYLQRYTLIGALGLSTADSDIDGRLPEYDVDKLHKDYMALYNQVIQLDSSLTKYHPDNWKQEPTGRVYSTAIRELGKVLVQLKSKSK